MRDTHPVPCHPKERSDAELHMLVCHRDVWPALLALKSLLRFSDVSVSLALTDDGSLTAGDRELISSHFPGCRWLRRREDQVRSVLTENGWDSLLKLYESGFSLSAKLLHPILLAEHSRIIVLDPDTAFFHKPDRLVSWLQNPAANLYTRDNNDQRDDQLDERIPQAFDDLRDELGVSHWQIKHYYFNSGLLAFRRDACDLQLAEGFLRWSRQHGSRFTFENASIWFGEWTAEQASYLVMFAAMDPPAESFGPEYRLGALGGTFSHFMRANLVRPDVLRQLSTLCGQMKKSG